MISPISSSSEYHSSFEEEDATTDQLQNPENLKEIGHFEAERAQEDTNGCDNEIAMEPTVTEIVSLSPESNPTSTNKPGYSVWDVEFNSTTAALKLNLVHKLTRKRRNYVAFSMDGKYLATASNSGIVSIFDSKTGKRIR